MNSKDLSDFKEVQTVSEYYLAPASQTPSEKTENHLFTVSLSQVVLLHKQAQEDTVTLSLTRQNV